MKVPLYRCNWYQSIWAALIFFTRLPFWRLYQPPRDSYRSVVEYWPLTGWLTGAMMAGTVYFGSMIMPLPLALALAIVVRLLTTGALHEDGLADFMDGFGGGGSNRERILSIMKDSHIGTYGTIALIVYFALLYMALSFLGDSECIAFALLAADPFSKMLSGQIIQMMPYARTADTAKNGVVYRPVTLRAGILLAIQGLVPLALLFWLSPFADIPSLYWVVMAPCLVLYLLYLLIWHRLKGYTGDCCGAVFLLTELTFHLTLAMLVYQAHIV